MSFVRPLSRFSGRTTNAVPRHRGVLEQRAQDASAAAAAGTHTEWLHEQNFAGALNQATSASIGIECVLRDGRPIERCCGGGTASRQPLVRRQIELKDVADSGSEFLEIPTRHEGFWQSFAR